MTIEVEDYSCIFLFVVDNALHPSFGSGRISALTLQVRKYYTTTKQSTAVFVYNIYLSLDHQSNRGDIKSSFSVLMILLVLQKLLPSL